MFGDMDRQVQQFNVLYDVEVVGWRESKFANVSGVNLVGDRFVHTLGWQKLTKLSRMAFLSTTSGLLATIGLLLRRLHDIAGRRLGGVRRVLRRLRQLQFQFSNAFRQIVDLLGLLGIPPSQIRNHVVLARHEANNSNILKSTNCHFLPSDSDRLG